MKLLSYFFILTFPLMCSKSPSPNADKEESYDVASEVLYAEDQPSSFNGLVSVPNQSIQQKVIKESYLRFETQDLDKTYSEIKRFVLQNKGYVQDDKSNKSYSTLTRDLIVRIPTDNFQKTIDSISRYVDYFDSKNISTKDVTEEFIDLEARLKAKKTLENRYLELLSKARNVKEILEIESELSKIREEIEAKQGRLKYLANKVAFSTLHIAFYKYTSESGVTVSYGTKMWNAIISGFNGLSLFFIGILNIWPLIIILTVLFFLIKKWTKKKKNT